MGISCSINEHEPRRAADGTWSKEPRFHQITQTTVKMVTHTPRTQWSTTGTLTDSDGSSNIARGKHNSNSKFTWMTHQHHQRRNNPNERNTVAAPDKTKDHMIAATGSCDSAAPSMTMDDSSVDIDRRVHNYWQDRKELRRRDCELGFESTCERSGSPEEHKADRILQALRRSDDENVYETEPSRAGAGGQSHARFAGDHFLANRTLIDKTKVFQLAQRAPKGAHLHIHFNACLQPSMLLGVAREMDHMYITSDVPLTSDDGADGQGRQGGNEHNDNLRRCKIQFSIMKPPASLGNLFHPDYKDRAPMKFSAFLEAFPRHYDQDAMLWLQRKLVFREEEAHGALQTVDGAWEHFNARTQMMKGLFNYETAYRKYTRQCLEDFVRDNIQYAEIRPNFMDTNQVWTDDGASKIDNVGIMKMIIEEYERFQDDTKGYLGGLKVIYCCPRSWPNEKVAGGLRECLEFKQRWPGWIAGFDLVGEEGKGRPLSAFVPEFLQFRADCEEARVEVPFLFHCGETVEAGSEADGNLLDALLLGSKRIGHGFALTRHPHIMEEMKKKGVCLELCPISNEVLGLTPRVNGHSMYSLLANNVHCTVNSDNGTLFNSTLSHDFYQVMIGKKDMTLFGWKQLVEWSLEHACMSEEEHAVVHREWEKRWNEYVEWIIEEFDEDCPRP